MSGGCFINKQFGKNQNREFLGPSPNFSNLASLAFLAFNISINSCKYKENFSNKPDLNVSDILPTWTAYIFAATTNSHNIHNKKGTHHLSVFFNLMSMT